jgi:type I restriction enzyme M protein
MPKKRDVLASFTRDELSEAVDRFELTVGDRRVKDQLVEALAASHKATLPAVLEAFSRDRLKELCRTLDLDDGGREKTALIERLASPAAPPAPVTTGLARAVPASRNRTVNGTDQPEPPLTGQLTRDQLQRYVWSAADILRGSIDSSDYKSFIFGLLFLKRLSDRFEEECEDLRAKKLNPEDPDEHQFFVPKRARWSELQRVATNVGEALNKACAALEDSNSRTLEGVLAGIDYNDERKLGDARNRDSVLLRLVQHFSKINLRNSNLSEPDMLGGAYEFLIEHFADDAGKKGGEFYTPRKVVELIVSLLAPTEGMRIHDPTCGSGGMLIECAKYIERKGGNPKNLSLFGQEKNLGTWAICKMNMLLHGLPDARIEKGDTIRDPKLVQDGALMIFDRVIANPPFSLDEWGREVAENDAYGRFRFGIPPKSKGDLAFVQHMVAVLNKQGQLGVVMPHGVLFRGGSEGEIRKGFLKEDLVEAVIGLAPNLFYGTGIPAAILVLNRKKKPERRGKVLLINAAEDLLEGTAQNYLRDQDVEKISKTFHIYRDVERHARVVPVAEIEKNDFNLNITRYIETAEAEEKVDVSAAVAKLRELEKARAEAEARMNGFLSELGYVH